MSTIPQLKLYPVYSWGRPYEPRNGLNANSAWTIPRTDFTPSYPVNTAPRTNWADRNVYFSLNSNQTLQQQPIGSAADFSKNLAFDGTKLGGLKQATTPATAPQTPDLYREMVALMSVSDLKFADFMAQPEFRIPQNGIGIKVTTDGMGNVDNVSLDPSLQKTIPRVATTDPAFTQMNRSEIMFRATLRSPDAVPPVLNSQPAAGPRGVQVPGAADNILPQGLQQPQGLQGLQGLLQRGNDLQAFDTNPVLQRLFQLQPPDNGLNVIGFDSVLDPAQSRQIAVGQAGFDVARSEQFRDHLANLKAAAFQNSMATEKGMVYPSAAQVSRAMDGMIPMAPSLPAPPKAASDSGLAFAGQDNRFNFSGGVEDTASKRGSGGYLYFNMGSGGGEGSMGQSPFASAFSGGGASGGGSARQEQQRRQPLRYFA